MYDEEIEKAMLYYIIFQDEQFELTEADFVNATHKKIIKAINELKAKREDISIITINNKIDPQKEENLICYIGTIGDYITFQESETVYKILKEYTKKRQVFNLVKTIKESISNTEDVDIYIEKIIKILHNIEFQTTKEINFRQQVIKTIEEIEKNIFQKEDYSLRTGYFELDSLTDGLHNGEFTVIGARPRSSERQLLLCSLLKTLLKKEKMLLMLV